MHYQVTMAAGATLLGPTSTSPCPCSSRSPSTAPESSPSLSAGESLPFLPLGFCFQPKYTVLFSNGSLLPYLPFVFLKSNINVHFRFSSLFFNREMIFPKHFYTKSLRCKLLLFIIISFLGCPSLFGYGFVIFFIIKAGLFLVNLEFMRWDWVGFLVLLETKHS